MSPLLLAGVLLASAGVPTDRLDDVLRRERAARKACGPRAVWHCLRRLGVAASFDAVCDEVGLDEQGSTVDRLVEAFRRRGLPAQVVEGPTSRLHELPVPSILVVNKSHVIVYEGPDPDGDGVRYYETATRSMKTATRGAFERDWSGVAIIFESPQLSVSSFVLLAATAAVAVMLLGGAAHVLSWPRRQIAPPAGGLSCEPSGGVEPSR